MKVSVLKRIYHDLLGRLEKGRIVELPDRMAERYLQAGAVQRYETKVIHEAPLVEDAKPVRTLTMPKRNDKNKKKS